MWMKSYLWMIAFFALSLPAAATTLYWSGSGTWTDGGAGQWSAVSGSGYGSASWTNGDSAVFEGSSGTVTLGGPITVSNMFIAVGGYTIASNTLTFVPGGTITNDIDAAQTISSGIVGQPVVGIADDRNAAINFVPSGSSQKIGFILAPYEVGFEDKCIVTLGGSVSGNTVTEIDYQRVPDNHYSTLNITGSGEWTTGEIDIGRVTPNGGTIYINGTLTTLYSGLFAIQSGARFGGNLNYVQSDSRSGHFIVNSGGIVAPGSPDVNNGVGTLSIRHSGSGADPVHIFNDGAIYEFHVGESTSDTIHLIYDATSRVLDLNNFILRILDAGGTPSANEQLPVFTYETGYTIDMTGYSNTVANFDVSSAPGWALDNPSLTDDGAGTIYAKGIIAPAKGTLIQLR